MKALCLGGLGFIGSNLVDELVKRDIGVHVIDNLSAGKWENRNDGAEYTIGSILDKELVFNLVKNVDVVFHLAAVPRVQKSIDDVIGTNAVNIDGTINLLEAIRKINPTCKLIYSSSSSVYGVHESPEMKENMGCRPLSPYALQKYTSEYYCLLYRRLLGLNIVSLRYFNVYGYRQVMDGPYSLVIAKFLAQKKEGKPMTIYGDGEQTRSYTHVSDVVNANIKAMEVNLPPQVEPVFNIGTDIETSVNKIARLIGGEVEHIIPNPRGALEEQRKYADYSKALKYLHWKPLVKIEEGIKLCNQI